VAMIMARAMVAMITARAVARRNRGAKGHYKVMG